MTDPPDDLAELLQPQPMPEPDPALREVVFRRTAHVVAWAGRLRVYRRIAAVLAVFALGGVVGWAAKPGPAPPHEPMGLRYDPAPVTVPVVVAVPSAAATPDPVTVAVPVVVPVLPATPSSAVAEAPVSAPQLELRAEQADDPAEAAGLYRRAGDAYLTGRDDYPNAARCYRLYLVRAGDTALSPDPGDTWLLTSLKNSAFKEKAHAARNGG